MTWNSCASNSWQTRGDSWVEAIHEELEIFKVSHDLLIKQNH